MNTKITFALLFVLFAACNNAEKAPYTADQYDSIMSAILVEKDSVLAPYVAAGDIPKSVEITKLYKARFDSVFAEQQKYFPGNN